jgi:hypothetical protein
MTLGDKQDAGARNEKHAARNGFVSGMNCWPLIALAKIGKHLLQRLIGRQAPVKRCLARCAGLASRLSIGKAPAKAGAPTKKLLSVRQHLLDAGHIRLVH